MNYEEDVTIDGQALDQEWLRQPQLMMKYCRHSAQAQKDLDAAKEKLDVVRVTLDKDIRSNPEKYELSKITDAVVANTIILQESYTEENGNYLQVKYEADMAKGAVRALEQKKDALEYLVKLFGMNYFSGPRMPLEINREWERQEVQKQSNAKIKLKRRSDG